MHFDFPWHLYLMAAIYIIAGLNHFRKPRMYQNIIPPYFSNPKLLNQLAGLAEIVLGILLCFQKTTVMAAWGVIALLIAVFPANLFMYQDQKAGFGLPKWLLFIRLPLQLLLMFWAWCYT